jgi:hypothetical protein
MRGAYITPGTDMADEDDAQEVQPMDDPEEKVVRREIREIIPDDTMPEVNDPEPPELSVGGVLGVVRKKGLIGAISDDAWGPHVHLLMLISIIFIVAVVIAIIQVVTG